MSNQSVKSGLKEVMITREALENGSSLPTARAAVERSEALYLLRSDAEIEAVLANALSRRPDTGSVWVFGFASLMWNPAIDCAERRGATLSGWHRRFCVWAPLGRGTPERPGLMLGLEQGGSTDGICFRLPPGEEETS
jgi:cation transport protein ChaC